MLDDYRGKQELAYNLFVNELNNNMLSHAYLIDDNNSNDSFGIVISFIKSILCDNGITSKCNDCNKCKLIDEGNYPELKFIKPDGMYIKKGQLTELQEDFSKSSVYGNRKIYIIFECEKMRSESANAILKFLEEPNSLITAFLITNNFNNVLPTIVSRCQIVKLNNNNNILSNEYEDISIDFIRNVEDMGINYFTMLDKFLLSKIDIKNRDNMIFFLDNMISMYYDIMNVKINKLNLLYFSKYIDDYGLISSKNDLDKIITKINFLIDAKDSIKYNVNINLLLDNIIINLGGKNESSRS